MVRAPLPPALDARRALLGGALAGCLWSLVVAVVLPPYADFGVAFRNAAGLGWDAPALFGIASALAGPVLIVGVPVALALRFRLLAPLAVAAFEIGVFLRRPGAGDSVGSAASLLWPVGLALIAGLALAEWAIRRGLAARLPGERDADRA